MRILAASKLCMDWIYRAHLELEDVLCSLTIEDSEQVRITIRITCIWV